MTDIDDAFAQLDKALDALPQEPNPDPKVAADAAAFDMATGMSKEVRQVMLHLGVTASQATAAFNGLVAAIKTGQMKNSIKRRKRKRREELRKTKWTKGNGWVYKSLSSAIGSKFDKEMMALAEEQRQRMIRDPLYEARIYGKFVNKEKRCPLTYGSMACGVAHPIKFPDCNKTFQHCTRRGNAHHFQG